MGTHEKPQPKPAPNDPPGSGDGVPADVVKPGEGKRKPK